jgi:hypothetical protein
LSNTIDSFSAIARVMRSSGSVSSLLDILNNDLGSGCADFTDFVGSGVVAESTTIGNSLDHCCG